MNQLIEVKEITKRIHAVRGVKVMLICVVKTHARTRPDRRPGAVQELGLPVTDVAQRP